MNTVVKICGLSDEATLDAALDAGADMIGLVFFAPSPRNVTLARGSALARRVHGRAAIVALTVDADKTALEAIMDAVRPDFLQCHGSETAAHIAALRTRFGAPIIKAVGVEGRDDLAPAAQMARCADMLLLDAKPPRGAPLPGGNGAAFDWALVADFSAAAPVLLSGGLNPDNVARAIRETRLGGVDVSSGVEHAPGRKDAAKIEAFIANARRAWAAADAAPVLHEETIR